MKELITSLIDKLTELDGLHDAITSIQKAYPVAAAELDALKVEIESANLELTQAKSSLSVAQLKNIRDHDEAVFAKAQELKDLTAKADEASRALVDLNDKVAQSSAKHKQLEASIESMRKRFG